VAARSAPPNRSVARPASPRRAAPSAENRDAAEAPVFGSRGAGPTLWRQARFIAVRRPSAAARAAASSSASSSGSAPSSGSAACSLVPRSTNRPRQVTPVRPPSSISVASSCGLECSATQAVKPTASTKKASAALVSASKRRGSPRTDWSSAIMRSRTPLGFQNGPASFPARAPDTSLWRADFANRARRLAPFRSLSQASE
jgi:hypothetical protein